MTTYCRWGARGTGGDEHPDGERASPEFTGKAVVIGLAIGCLLCFTNLYFGLRPRLPQSLMTGLVWFGTQDYQSFQRTFYAHFF